MPSLFKIQWNSSLTKCFQTPRDRAPWNHSSWTVKAEILDAMYETLESGSQAISTVKDMMFNVRSEVKQLQPLASTVDLIRHELNGLVEEVEKLEGKMKFTYVCRSCGKPLLPEFKICPYCGEDSQLLRAPAPLVSLDERK